MIPYLSPELIAAILKVESTSAVDLQKDSKSATENSFPALRFRSAVNKKPVRVPFLAKGFFAILSSIFAPERIGSPLVSIEDRRRSLESRSSRLGNPAPKLKSS
jgi:hypothetical protein